MSFGFNCIHKMLHLYIDNFTLWTLNYEKTDYNQEEEATSVIRNKMIIIDMNINEY